VRRLKRALLLLTVFIVVAVILTVIVVGPWPVYKGSNVSNTTYCREAVKAIGASVSRSEFTDTPGELSAGWGIETLVAKEEEVNRGIIAALREKFMAQTEKWGILKRTPMAGPLPNTDANKASGPKSEDLHSKALCLSDGRDTVALIGTDLFIVSPNVAELTRKKIASAVRLTEDNILFCASHTHTGPRHFAQGLFYRLTIGKWDPAVSEAISTSMANTVIMAYRSMAPAKLAHGQVNAPEFIGNYMRNAASDSMVKYMVVEKLTGEKCFVVRYSAHPTSFDESLDFQGLLSADYPGAMLRQIESETGGTALYLGGATGSMASNFPKAPTPKEKMELMGKELAAKVLGSIASSPLKFTTRLDIASVGFPVRMPTAQVRLMNGARLSPIFIWLLGIRAEGWVQAIRLGDILMLGLPYDVSGEIARQWSEELTPKGWDLWVEGFSGAYCGYLSPDKYYDTDVARWELGLMNWFGPNAEEYMCRLKDEIVSKMAASNHSTQN